MSPANHLTTDSESTHLTNLLTSLRVTSLGEGDVNAGTNLLAAMAVTLGNLAGQGSGIRSPGLGHLKTGTSLLASGSLTPSLITDRVTLEVATCQNNLIQHLRRFLVDKVADARKKGSKMLDFPEGPPANHAENLLHLTEQRDTMVPDEVPEAWREIFSVGPNPRLDEVANRPKFVITPRNPGDLAKQLDHFHGNRSLAIIGVTEAREVERYGGICGRLLNGPYPVGEFGEMAEAHLLVIDSVGALDETARHVTPKSAWLGKSLSVVDGDSGPDAIENHPQKDKIRPSDVPTRFHKALLRVLSMRFNNHSPSPVLHAFDLGGAQMRWVSFLRKMEPRLPGISGIARGLLSSLAFGLIELTKAPGQKQWAPRPREVEALARWLVRRMARFRTSLLESTRSQWLLSEAGAIFEKLSEKDWNERDLYRAQSLDAGTCRLILHELERAGLVRHEDRMWSSTGQEAHRFQEKFDHLFLEA